MTEHRLIYAYDTIINIRVPFVLHKGYAISLVTKYKFKYKPKRECELKND